MSGHVEICYEDVPLACSSAELLADWSTDRRPEIVSKRACLRELFTSAIARPLKSFKSISALAKHFMAFEVGWRGTA